MTESLISEVKQNCTFWAHHWNLSYQNLLQIVTESCNKNICTEMGINAIKYSHRGTFFVATSDTSPFCSKKYIKYKNCVIFAHLYICIMINFLIFIVNDTRIIAELVIQLKKDFPDEFYD